MITLHRHGLHILNEENEDLTRQLHFFDLSFVKNFTRRQQRFVTNLMTVDLQIGCLHKVAEEVGMVLQVC